MSNTGKIPIIGLTGGMGSGKSTISAMLAARGGCILDADKINHEQMQKGRPAYTEIVKRFGTDILDANSEIARRKLAAVVFGDAALLRALEDIAHRHVIAETLRTIEALRVDNCGYRFIVIDAPLLIEANMQTICDAVWVVAADEDIRIARVLARDGITREQALARMQKQMPQAQRIGYADCVLSNNSGVDALEAEVDGCLRNVLCH